MEGTSLQSLQEKEIMERVNNANTVQQLQQSRDTHYNNLQHLQSEQGHNTQHAVHQNQHDVYVSPQVGMADLARNINNNFQPEVVPEEETSDESYTIDGGLLNRVPKNLREPLVLILIFIILSNHDIKNFVGRYIKQINPDYTGRVPLVGVIIYGVIYASLFHLSKRYWK